MAISILGNTKTMIQEDFVGFEMAKLLKEKGFANELDLWYDKDGHKFFCYHYDIKTNYRVRHCEKVYECPTLQMAMKWLREVHHIFISIQMHLDGSYVWYLYRTDQTPQGCDRESHNHSYEQACGAAIKFCLEHIV